MDTAGRKTRGGSAPDPVHGRRHGGQVRPWRPHRIAVHLGVRLQCAQFSPGRRTCETLFPEVHSDALLLWKYFQWHPEPRPCSEVIPLDRHGSGYVPPRPSIVMAGATSLTTEAKMPREAASYGHALALGITDSAILAEPSARNPARHRCTPGVLQRCREADAHISPARGMGSLSTSFGPEQRPRGALAPASAC